jgi:hypothetical protein
MKKTFSGEIAMLGTFDMPLAFPNRT